MRALYQTSITLPSPEIAMIAALLPAGRALDLGCGIGTESIYLAKHGWQVDGVDLSTNEIKTARRRRKRLEDPESARFHEVNILSGFVPEHGVYDLVNDRLFSNNLFGKPRKGFKSRDLNAEQSRKRVFDLAAHALKPGGLLVIRYRQLRDDNWGKPSHDRFVDVDRKYAKRYFEIGPELGYRSMFNNVAWIRLSIIALRRNARPFRLKA